MAVDSHRHATLGGVPMKLVSLVSLTFQNSALILLMHYSRIMPPVHGQRYFASTAVFMNEVIKLALSLTLALYEMATKEQSPNTSAVEMFVSLFRAVFSGDSWKLAIPAMLYTLQNSLQYVAVSNLDAATFQVAYQLKILTTALFSVTLLGRKLDNRRWLSLVLLVIGVAIVSISSQPRDAHVLSMKDLMKDGTATHAVRNIWELKALGNEAAGQLTKRSATYEGIDADLGYHHLPPVDASIGLTAAIVACAVSGLSGVYFEKVLKESKPDSLSSSLWIRNVQLSFYSLWPALFLGVFFKDGEHIAKTGFFTGYNWVVWVVIVMQSLGGINAAMVVKYADNIVKNFATSISIVVSFLASVIFFDFEITILYVFGTGVVLTATWLYNNNSSSGFFDRNSQPPPVTISYMEKSQDQAYFDLEAITGLSKTPLRGEGLSTSRPGTPNLERHHRRNKSSEGARLARMTSF